MLIDHKRVFTFVNLNPNCYRMEIASATGFQRERADQLLDELLADGALTVSGIEQNQQTFRSSTYVPPVPEPANVDKRSREEIWNDKARADGLAAFALLHPVVKPEPDVELVVPNLVRKPYTASEWAAIEEFERTHGGGRGVNPQGHLL